MGRSRKIGEVETSGVRRLLARVSRRAASRPDNGSPVGGATPQPEVRGFQHSAYEVLSRYTRFQRKDILEVGGTQPCVGGDHASMVGTFAIMDADGNELDHGKWMNAIHKIDGKWMIEGDIWNSDVPLSAASGSSD